MRTIALGTNAAYPGPNNACTGWLVEEGGTHLLLDCGTGVLSRLQLSLPLSNLSAVVITHMHADHFLDLLPLRYAYKYGLQPTPPPLDIFLPPGGRAFLQQMVSPFGMENEANFFDPVFQLQEYNPSEGLQLGPLTLTFAPTEHYIPAWAVAIQAGGRLVYTGDTAPSQNVGELAKGADLLISEATYLSLEEESPERRGHLTAREAGELAAYAQPRRTLLTHLWPHRDPQQVLAHARKAFSGALEVAQVGASYEV